MREQELIEEGFERVDILMEDSGDKSDYYYYNLQLNENFVLVSDESDEVTRDRWTVSCYEIDMCFKDIEDVQTMIALYKKCSSAV